MGLLIGESSWAAEWTEDGQGGPVTLEGVGKPCLAPSCQDHLPGLQFWLQHIHKHTRPGLSALQKSVSLGLQAQVLHCPPSLSHLLLQGTLHHGSPTEISKFSSLFRPSRDKAYQICNHCNCSLTVQPQRLPFQCLSSAS